MSPVVDVLLLMRMEKSCAEKSKSLYMLKVRNIVVYGVNLIHSAKSLAEKVSNKDVQICLTELESGFSVVVYPTYVAKLRR